MSIKFFIKETVNDFIECYEEFPNVMTLTAIIFVIVAGLAIIT